jgi:hypothetical protein
MKLRGGRVGVCISGWVVMCAEQVYSEDSQDLGESMVYSGQFNGCLIIISKVWDQAREGGFMGASIYVSIVGIMVVWLLL